MYPTDVHLKSGEVLTAGTIVWAAGVAAPEQWAELGTTDRSNRLEVSPTLQLHDDVWVIGDMAHVKGKDGRPLPMVASVAMQQGRYCAAAIVTQLKDNRLRTWSSSSSDGRQYITKGKLGDGKPVPWFNKCETN
jgi:NADH dehydrogenase